MDRLTVYHGSTITNCKSIMQMRKFNKSVSSEKLYQSLYSRKNTYQWLGDGIYFWVNNFEMAKYWAEIVSKNCKEDVGVIKTQICYDNSRCFDLTVEKNRKCIEEVINVLIESDFKQALNFHKLPRNEQNKFIGYACDFLFKNGDNMIKDYDLVYYVFIIDDKRFPPKQTAQVCIKNDNVIKYEDMIIVWNT